MVVWIVLAVIALYFIVTYNSLVNIKNNVEKAWANIDVLLKQRNDELPKLIDTCKVYMAHESQTLEKVIQARMGVDAARQTHDLTSLSKAESGLQASLGGLFAVAENYPDLKTRHSSIYKHVSLGWKTRSRIVVSSTTTLLQ